MAELEMVDDGVIERQRDAVPELNNPSKSIDTAPEKVLQDGEAADNRKAIIDKYASRNRDEMGIPEPTGEEPSDTVTIKVNGKERQVPRAKVEEHGGLDVYQKRLSAEDKLQEASLMKKELERKEAELSRKEAQFQAWQQQRIQRLAEEKLALTQTVGQSQTPPASPEAALEELIKRQRKALIEGEDDLADELMLKIQQYGKQPAPVIDPEEIAQRAYQRLQMQAVQERRAQELKSAQDEFAQSYRDIASDERLFAMADQETIRLKQENPSWSDRQIILTAGETVRRWKDGVMGGASYDDGDRRAAKQAMSAGRATSGRNPSRPAPRPQSPSEYIESIKAARGQR